MQNLINSILNGTKLVILIGILLFLAVVFVVFAQAFLIYILLALVAIKFIDLPGWLTYFLRTIYFSIENFLSYYFPFIFTIPNFMKSIFASQSVRSPDPLKRMIFAKLINFGFAPTTEDGLMGNLELEGEEEKIRFPLQLYYYSLEIFEKFGEFDENKNINFFEIEAGEGYGIKFLRRVKKFGISICCDEQKENIIGAKMINKETDENLILHGNAEGVKQMLSKIKLNMDLILCLRLYTPIHTFKSMLESLYDILSQNGCIILSILDTPENLAEFEYNLSLINFKITFKDDISINTHYALTLDEKRRASIMAENKKKKEFEKEERRLKEELKRGRSKMMLFLIKKKINEM